MNISRNEKKRESFKTTRQRCRFIRNVTIDESSRVTLPFAVNNTRQRIERERETRERNGPERLLRSTVEMGKEEMPPPLADDDERDYERGPRARVYKHARRCRAFSFSDRGSCSVKRSKVEPLGGETCARAPGGVFVEGARCAKKGNHAARFVCSASPQPHWHSLLARNGD